MKELLAQPRTVLVDKTPMLGNGGIDMLEKRTEIEIEHHDVMAHPHERLEEICMPEFRVRECGLMCCRR